MEKLKSIAKKIMPASVATWSRKRAIRQRRERNAALTTREVFSMVYQRNEWGGVAGEPYSGPGSEAEFTAAYCDVVKQFIADKKIDTVVDLGCGDFRVGRKLQVPGVTYLGVDIVPELIARNERLLGNDELTFACLDIIEDPLPDAGLCLIRQVLQHLSNIQISRVLEKLGKYPYVLITEHYPADGLPVTPNLDQPHGGDVRVLDNSAVYLDQPPFNVAGVTTILELKTGDYLVKDGETIRTMLIDRIQ